MNYFPNCFVLVDYENSIHILIFMSTDFEHQKLCMKHIWVYSKSLSFVDNPIIQLKQKSFTQDSDLSLLKPNSRALEKPLFQFQTSFERHRFEPKAEKKTCHDTWRLTGHRKRSSSQLLGKCSSKEQSIQTVPKTRRRIFYP